MAKAVYIDSYSYGAVNQSTKKQVVTVNVSCDYNTGIDHVDLGCKLAKTSPPGGTAYYYDIISGQSPGYPVDAGSGYGVVFDGTTTGIYLAGDPLDCDTTYYARANGYYWVDEAETTYFYRESAITSLKSYAIEATVNAPSGYALSSSQVYFGATYAVNTVESTATLYIEYKRTVDSTWTTYSTGGGLSGYSTNLIDTVIDGLTPSTSYDFRYRIVRTTVNSTSYTSASFTVTTLADAPTCAVGAASSITYQSATLNGTVDPNTKSCTVYYEYGTSPGVYSWSVYAGAFSGDGDQAAPAAISGLASSTTYYYRMKVYYDATNIVSSETSFTTSAPPPVPDITTGSYDSKTHNSCRVYGTVNPNTVATSYGFQWDTDPGFSAPGATTVGSSSAGAAFDYNYSITGLTANTLYYYRAFATYSGGTVYGSAQSFTTALSPSAEAALEDHLTIFEFNERKYGVETTFYFAVASPAATSSDRFFNSASPFASGDVKIIKDGGTPANTTNLPARVGTTGIFSLTLTATEMQATTIVVQIVDQDGPAFRDAALVVRTVQAIQTLDIAGNHAVGGNLAVTGNLSVGGTTTLTGAVTLAAGLTITGVCAISSNLTVGGNFAITGNLTAATIQGYLTSMVLRKNTAQAGASTSITLDASAVATDDFYNEATVMVVHASGRVQARVITNYVGSTKVATVNRPWSVENPASGDTFLILPGADVWDQVEKAGITSGIGGEPAGTDFGDDMTFRRIFQFIKRRLFNKAEMTTVTQTLYKDDSTTSLLTRGVGDVAGTQYQDKVTT